MAISEDVWLLRLYGTQLATFDDYRRLSAQLKTVVGPHVVALLRAGTSVVLDYPANTRATRAWFRGLLTCSALCYVTWSLAPGVEPMPGALPAPYNDLQLEAAQTVSIQPLAYGGETGRRMAPTDAVEPLSQSPERPIVDLRATVGRDDGVATILQRAGVAGGDADHVATLLASISTALRPGTTVDIRLGRRPDPTAARPQAWAAGAPVLMLQLLLGLQPDRRRHVLGTTAPEDIPSWAGTLRLTGVRAFDQGWDVQLADGRVTIEAA